MALCERVVVVLDQACACFPFSSVLVSGILATAWVYIGRNGWRGRVPTAGAEGYSDLWERKLLAKVVCIFVARGIGNRGAYSGYRTARRKTSWKVGGGEGGQCRAAADRAEDWGPRSVGGSCRGVRSGCRIEARTCFAIGLRLSRGSNGHYRGFGAWLWEKMSREIWGLGLAVA